VRVGVVGLQAQRDPVVIDGVFQASGLFANVAQVEVGQRVLWRGAQRLPVAVLRLPQIAAPVVERSDIHPSPGSVWIKFNRPAVGGDGVLGRSVSFFQPRNTNPPKNFARARY
jgi:hypothetical protein